MSNTVEIYVENIEDILDTYNQIKLYSDTDPLGSFTTLVTTITLTEDDETYSYVHSAGTGATWYRYTFFHSGSNAESGVSEIWRPTGLRLRDLRVEAARGASAGFASTCTDTGGSLSLIDTKLADVAADENFMSGAWVYRPDANVADRLRRIKSDGTGYSTSTFALVPLRAWGTPPASGEEYHVFNYFPPIDRPGMAWSWDRCVRDGLRSIWFEDEINLGEGTSARNPRFDLSQWLPLLQGGEQAIDKVLLRRTRTDGVIEDIDADKLGRFWSTIRNGADELKLEIEPAPRTDQTVIVLARRTFETLYQDSDYTNCPFDLAWRAATWQAFVRLNIVTPNKYVGEMKQAEEDFIAYLTRFQASRARSGA